MGHGSHHVGTVPQPGKYVMGAGFRNALVALSVLGAAVFLMGLAADPLRAWTSLLLGHTYFLLLALGGLFFTAIQHLTGSMWSATVRRLAEALTAYFPFALIGMVGVFLGSHHLYEWTHREVVEADLILLGKSGYLNMPFFVIRSVVAFAIWFLFARKFVGNSVTQDRTGEYGLSLSSRKWSPAFLILFAFSITMMSFDFLMSLDPHWFSTIYGVYIFSGMFYSTLALVCLLAVLFYESGQLKGIVNENHLHDLGKFMFAFTVFWAYIGFSQFMLIWYANLPEETGYYIKRMAGNWNAVSIGLFLIKFVAPFLMLIQRGSKRSRSRLKFVAVWMLAAQWLDLLWVIQPEFFAEGPRVGWIEIGTFLGFLGVFGLLVGRFLQSHSLVAVKDPRLTESVFGHHQ